MKARALIAEFIGTFALIFIGVMAIAMMTENRDGGALVSVALAHGLTIACLASATAAISGGHLNPAVTFGVMVTRKINIANGLAYIVAQLVGSVAGAAMAAYGLGLNGMHAVQGGTPSLAGGMSLPQGLVMEAVATFFLMFVIFGTAVDIRGPKVGALFIGLTVTLDLLAIGPLTGGAMNPARWFGPAAIGGSLGTNSLVWILGPFSGAALAAIVYTMFLEDKNPLPLDAEVRTN